jgi:hypothetical protein
MFCHCRNIIIKKALSKGCNLAKNAERGHGGSGKWSLVREKKSQVSGKSGETGQATRDLSICSTNKEKPRLLLFTEKECVLPISSDPAAASCTPDPFRIPLRRTKRLSEKGHAIIRQREFGWFWYQKYHWPFSNRPAIFPHRWCL